MTYRILIVANQTLGGEDLAAMVRERVQGGATELWVVVPATHPRDQSVRTVAATGTAPEAGSRYALELAEERLEAARERLGALGVAVGGEVGDGDPFQAVSDALAHRQVDEVIISTLPTGRSRWLSADLPSRVRRAFGVPVTTVIGRVVGRS